MHEQERPNSQIDDLRGEIAFLRQQLQEANQANQDSRRIIAELTRRTLEQPPAFAEDVQELTAPQMCLNKKAKREKADVR